MFDKIKQLKQLKEMQEQLKKEELKIEKQGVKVVFNNNMELKELKLNPSLSFQEQEKIIVEIFDEAIKKIQMNVAGKMSQYKDLGL